MFFKTPEWRVPGKGLFRGRFRLNQQGGAAGIGGTKHIGMAIADEPDIPPRRNAAPRQRHMDGGRVWFIGCGITRTDNLAKIAIESSVFRFCPQQSAALVADDRHVNLMLCQHLQHRLDVREYGDVLKEQLPQGIKEDLVGLLPPVAEELAEQITGRGTNRMSL